MDTQTLQSLQDQLAVLQAESAQNDANYTAGQRLATAQYNQRHNTITAAITAIEASITKLTPSN